MQSTPQALPPLEILSAGDVDIYVTSRVSASMEGGVYDFLAVIVGVGPWVPAPP